MTYDRDRFIAAQNAASAAATIIAAETDPAEPTSVVEVLQRFESYRTAIFLGTLDLGAIESAPPAPPASAPPTPQAGPAGYPERPPVPQTYTAPSSPVPPPRPDDRPKACPKCGGQMWDNRAGKKNPKAPDFRCKDNNCDGVVWPPR